MSAPQHWNLPSTPAKTAMNTTHLTAAFLLLTAALHAQSSIPANTCLERLRARFGPDITDHLIEMTGTQADPQPAEWRVTLGDPAHGGQPHEFWVGDRRVTDEGVSREYYPEKLPKGFIARKRLKLDSTQAFAIAEQVARDAKVGFDGVNYKLHCREYSDEPVWTLTLLSADAEILASIHLSAESGDLLRTVWLRPGRNGRRAVDDSALDSPNRQSLAGPDSKPAPKPEPRPEPKPDSPAFGRSEASGEVTVTDKPTSPKTPAPPAALPPGANPLQQEIPEVIKLNEAQERALKK